MEETLFRTRAEAANGFHMLHKNFRDAILGSVKAGPRNEVTLLVAPIKWEGNQGTHTAELEVRFGGLEDFTSISKVLRDLSDTNFEIGYLGLKDAQGTKDAGKLTFRLLGERSSTDIDFSCSSASIRSLERD